MLYIKIITMHSYIVCDFDIINLSISYFMNCFFILCYL